MRLIAIHLIGVVLLRPMMVMPWNRAGRRNRSTNHVARPATAPRWRLEIYSMDDSVTAALVAKADVSAAPMSVVRSPAGGQEPLSPAMRWTEPRVELDVGMMDPFTDESLTALLGPDHRVRFVTGNEAVVDTATNRLRIRRFRFG